MKVNFNLELRVNRMSTACTRLSLLVIHQLQWYTDDVPIPHFFDQVVLKSSCASVSARLVCLLSISIVCVIRSSSLIFTASINYGTLTRLSSAS